MLTKNGAYNIMENMVCRHQSDSSFEMKNVDGNVIGVTGYASFSWDRFQEGSSAGMKLVVGVGNTPPTYNDYCLDETEIGGVNIDTLISTANGAITVDNMGQYNITATFTNMSSQPIDIQEMGLVAYGSGNRITNTWVLMARSVVPKKTLQPSDNVTLTYTISPLQI